MMENLNFASFACAIEKGMAKPTHIGITRLLLGLIVDDVNVLNSDGQPYNISNYYVNRWWHQHEDIPGPIKEAAASTEIMSIATAYFENSVIPKLSPQKEGDTYSTLWKLVKQDTDISDDTRQDLLAHYDNNELSKFLAETFLYAIQKNNKGQNTDKVMSKTPSNAIVEDVLKLEELLQRFPRPIKLIPPNNLATHEMIYITELLSAYADHAGIPKINKDDLGNYPKYKKNFDRQRKDYYAAETIRQYSKDTLTISEMDEFDILQEETLDGIIEVYEDEYADGFSRLNNVMKHATTIQLNKSLLSKLPGFISSSEKKGVCHLLVNDGQIKWVSDDE